VKPRTRNAWFTLTDAQGGSWKGCWKPHGGCLVVSLPNGKRRPGTAFMLTAAQVIRLAQSNGTVVGPPVQTEIPMP
jgi:hypothetical protein